jgi:hypothetical protein
MNIKHFLWILPFFCFIGSYFVFHYLLAPPPLMTPALIGKQLQDAVQSLSDHTLNARIVSQKEDNDLAAGTIISQIPGPCCKIRAHQSVFLVVSKKAPLKKAPLLLQQDRKTVERIATEQEIVVKIHYLPSHYPHNICIGQIPSFKEPLPENRITAYLSSGATTKPVILPDFKKHPVGEVTSFLTENNIKFHIFHAKPTNPTHECKHCLVIDQKPLAGSLIDLKKSLTLQLYAQEG